MRSAQGGRSRKCWPLVLAATTLFPCGALPGEMRGCDTDLSDEVSHIEYCRDRCAVLCERVITCGLYVSEQDPLGDVAAMSDMCREQCETDYGCVNPQICMNPKRYISEREAADCLEAWSSMHCIVIQSVPSCGSKYADCPRPQACTKEVLCDPPEWE